MAQIWNWTWLTVAFAAELAALVALAAWGWSAGGLLLAIAVPLAAAVLWGLVAAPRSVVDAPVAAVLVKIVVLGGASLALVALGRPVLGAVLAAAALLSALLSTPPVEVSGPSG